VRQQAAQDTLGFLHHLLVDHFDIQPNAVAVPSEQVFGHALLVSGCQLVAYDLSMA
jgi:hypothetical protein